MKSFKILSLSYCTMVIALFMSCKKENNQIQFTGTVAALRCRIGVVNVDGSSEMINGTLWQDYKNAVTVSNPCRMVDMGLKSGDRIGFKIDTNKASNTKTESCGAEYYLMDVLIPGSSSMT